jgi:hypothetical protein
MAVGCSVPDYLQAEWVLTEPPQGTSLEVMVSAGNTCTEYDRVEVDETADSVHLRAFVRRTGDTGCADLLHMEQVTVELKQPLGDRALLGCADEDIAVGGLRLEEDGDCRDPQPSP